MSAPPLEFYRAAAEWLRCRMSLEHGELTPGAAFGLTLGDCDWRVEMRRIIEQSKRRIRLMP